MQFLHTKKMHKNNPQDNPTMDINIDCSMESRDRSRKEMWLNCTKTCHKTKLLILNTSSRKLFYYVTLTQPNDMKFYTDKLDTEIN